MLTTWLGWEWIFFINVPVGVAAGLLTLRLVPSAPAAGPGRRGLDLPGAVSVVAGLVLLVDHRGIRPRLGLGPHAAPVRRLRGSAGGLPARGALD